MKNIFKLIISLGFCATAAAIGGVLTAPAIPDWYQRLNKPSFTPSGAIIGLVWTVLYLSIAISLYLVWKNNWEINWPRRNNRKIWNPVSEKLMYGSWRKANAIIIFAAQLALNIVWSLIFFKIHLPGLAFFELLMLWTAIAYTIANFSRISKPAAYLLIPYLLWVGFAGCLNFVIWQMNP